MESPLDVGIVLSTWGLIRGGVETRAGQLARGLAERGHRVTMVGGLWPGRSLPEDVRQLPVRRLRVPCVPLDLKPWRHVRRRRPGWPSQLHTATFRWNCRFSPAVRRLIAHAQVTVTLLARDTVYVSAWRKRHAKPNLSYFNGGGRRFLEQDHSVVMVANPKVWENCPYMSDFPFEGEFPPGVPAELLKGRFEVRPLARRLLFVGRLEVNKGVFELLDIFVRLAADFPQTELRLVGDGPLRPEIQRRICEAGYGDRLSFAGALAPEDVWKEMTAADLLLLPMDHGNFPLTLLESEAVGLPLVSSDLPGIRGGVNPEGCLLPFGEWDLWTQQLRRLIPDPQARERMSRSGRQWARNYTWERSVEKMEELLRLAASRVPGERENCSGRGALRSQTPNKLEM